MLSPAVFESLMLLVTLHSVSPLAAVVSTGMIHQVDEAPNHNPNETLSLSSCSFYLLPQITVFKLISKHFTCLPVKTVEMPEPGKETRKTRFFPPKTPQYLGKKRAGRRDQIGLSSHQRNKVYFIAHTTGLLKQRNRNVA